MTRSVPEYRIWIVLVIALGFIVHHTINVDMRGLFEVMVSLPRRLEKFGRIISLGADRTYLSVLRLTLILPFPIVSRNFKTVKN